MNIILWVFAITMIIGQWQNDSSTHIAITFALGVAMYIIIGWWWRKVNKEDDK